MALTAAGRPTSFFTNYIFVCVSEAIPLKGSWYVLSTACFLHWYDLAQLQRFEDHRLVTDRISMAKDENYCQALIVFDIWLWIATSLITLNAFLNSPAPVSVPAPIIFQSLQIMHFELYVWRSIRTAVFTNTTCFIDLSIQNFHGKNEKCAQKVLSNQRRLKIFNMSPANTNVFLRERRLHREKQFAEQSWQMK